MSKAPNARTIVSTHLPVSDVVELSNVVLTSVLNMPIDLEGLSWKLGADLNPTLFAAAKLRLRWPPTTALIFSTGKLVVTGASTESAALFSLLTFYKQLKGLHPGLRLMSYTIQNLVASISFNRYIDLDGLYKEYPHACLFDPTLFPGLRLRIVSPKIKVLVFVRGRIVLTGGKNRQDLLHAYRLVRGACEPFFLANPMEHDALLMTKALKRKRLAASIEAGEDDEAAPIDDNGPIDE
jgi:transcription initiation factor TFIID TATA-box-binding protein